MGTEFKRRNQSEWKEKSEKESGEGQENVTTLEMMSAPVHKGYSLLHPEQPFVLVQDPTKEITDLNPNTISVKEQRVG